MLYVRRNSMENNTKIYAYQSATKIMIYTVASDGNK